MSICVLWSFIKTFTIDRSWINWGYVHRSLNRTAPWQHSNRCIIISLLIPSYKTCSGLHKTPVYIMPYFIFFRSLMYIYLVWYRGVCQDLWTREIVLIQNSFHMWTDCKLTHMSAICNNPSPFKVAINTHTHGRQAPNKYYYYILIDWRGLTGLMMMRGTNRYQEHLLCM